MGSPDTYVVSGKDIEAAGWRQGSLLPAGAGIEHVAWFHHQTQGLARPGRRQIEAMRRKGETPLKPVLLHRPNRAGDRLVVLSQTCDVVKAPDAFPLVEVGLAFVTENAQVIVEARQLGSARFHALRPAGEGVLVLDYRWRTMIDKGFLVRLAPDNSVLEAWSVGEAERLARWLGRRYGRPVLSDVDVAEVLNPIRAEWRRVMEQEGDFAGEASEVFIEFRFRRIEGGVEVYVLSPDDEPDEVLALEVFGVLEEALRPIHGRVVTRTDKITYDTFTRSDDLNTKAIDLDWASDEEPGCLLPPD